MSGRCPEGMIAVLFDGKLWFVDKYHFASLSDAQRLGYTLVH